MARSTGGAARRTKPGDRPGDLPAGPAPDPTLDTTDVPEVRAAGAPAGSGGGLAAGNAGDLAAGPISDLPAGPDPDHPGVFVARRGGGRGAERRTGLAAGPPVPGGSERRRQHAYETAWRFLAHRERTEAELRARLERNDVAPALVDEVVGELRDGGYVDDAGFARRFAEDRRNLDGWGAERIERRLGELGVAREDIHVALADGAHDELEAACELLARRFPTPPDTPRDHQRALGFLVRKGYELELAHDALRRHATSAVER
ncbi:MAG TPA: regulatory protein RecX [Solirubrobacter sp.]|nr:regulatory protein RecX [Solirubrobacter sp.]